MPAELTVRNGLAEMFSVAETPWHREGHVLTAAPTYEEALVLAGLDFDVELRPYSYQDNAGAARSSERAFATVRTDRGVELGAVGPDYRPISNREGFAILRPLLEQGVARLETGGSLRNGADCWLLVKWDVGRFGPVVREVFADEIVPFSTVMLNHSGRRGALIGNTPIRVVCANTLGMAETDGVASRWTSVRHVGDAPVKLIEAAEQMWGALIERFEVIAKQYRAMKAAVLAPAEFDDLVLDVLAPDPRLKQRWNPEARMANAVVARWETKRSALQDVWVHGRGHVGDHSAWEAYNGTVQLLDHNRELFPTRAGVYRTASLLTGHLAWLKQRVTDNLVAYAQAGGYVHN